MQPAFVSCPLDNLGVLGERGWTPTQTWGVDEVWDAIEHSRPTLKLEVALEGQEPICGVEPKAALRLGLSRSRKGVSNGF